MTETKVQFLAPASLWPTYTAGNLEESGELFHRPHVLRFATDAFMQEFMTMLQNAPQRLGEWIAKPEQWQAPASNPGPIDQMPPLLQRLHRVRLATALPLNRFRPALPASTGVIDSPGTLTVTSNNDTASSEPLKLYQPAHMRYYLVTTCLVCSLPGLPDRMIDFGSGERVTYVVRRLRPKVGSQHMPSEFNLDTCDEYAFVNGNEWQLASADRITTGEEQLPMFGVSYVERDGRKRRLLSAPVPVSKRETYMGAAASRIVPDPQVAIPVAIDPRKAVLLRTVTDPWRTLIKQAARAAANLSAPIPPGQPTDGPSSTDINTAAAQGRDMAIAMSWLILLDFGDYLARYVKKVWDVVTGAATLDTLVGAELTLYSTLNTTRLTDDTGHLRSLAWALKEVQKWRDVLENTTTPYSTLNAALHPELFPDFRFPLNTSSMVPLVVQPPTGTTIDDRVVNTLPHDMPAGVPPLPLAARMTGLDNREPGWFIIRCVFERPNCVPARGPIISAPTEPFQMAAFFDPQAPARPIQINLPLDVTAAGLRKFDRNTAFVISDALCAQMNRMGNITLGDLVMSVLPWPLHKDLPVADSGACVDGVNIGMICSLSIPIVTICALILLMIIVSLLDFVFRWMPYLIMCFPMPKLTAKPTQG